jgi:pimeloyl-ACP methyl ester carboxylesterase
MRSLSQVIIWCFPLFFFAFPLQFVLADETGYRFPTTCVTNGSSCENMRTQDAAYNSWTNATYEFIDVTFTDFGVPESAIIDDIQIKLRIRTNTFGWSWFPRFSDNNGVFLYSPYLCSISPNSCQYNTTEFFNSISSVTMTWLNTNKIKTVTGAMLNSPLFIFELWQNLGVKNTDIDVLLFNIRYHTAAPTPTPTATPAPTPTPAKTPLLLIPGIGGSEFKTAEAVHWSQPDGHGGTFTHAYPAEEKVWVNTIEAIKPGEDDYFDILRLKADGQTEEAGLALTGNLFEAYQGAIDFFVSNGYTLNKDLYVFPYDWRKDIALTALLLDQKIESIKQQTGSSKVDIVAHSMGGLVARNYIADAGRAGKVKRLFVLGTPHLGAVDSIKLLLYGSCFTKPGVPTQPLCIGITKSEVRDVIRNMLGVFQLIPSQRYFDFYSGEDNFHPFPFRDDRDMDNNGIVGPLNYSQIKTLLSNLGQNTNLFGSSEMFHGMDDNLVNTNGVEVTNIVGSGMPTLGQIIEKYSIDFLGVKVPHRDELFVNGDQTVPLFSASLIDSGRNKSLLGNAKVFYTKQEHGSLISGPALNLVKNILNNNSQLPDGISNQAYVFSGTGVSVHSPVTIHAYDSFGNHTGPTSDGNFEANIPDSIYDTLDDAKFIWLPDDGQYTIKLEATDQGSFDFKIRKFENDINISTAFYDDVPLTASTKAQANLDTSSIQPPTLQIDQDGNGTIDKDADPAFLLTGDANYDETPPQTVVELSGVQGQNNWYRGNVTIVLTAQDDAGGSGVQKTEYSLDNGQTVQTYTGPFTISQEGVEKIKFRSTDKAGNAEIPQEAEIKIDKTPPEAKIFIDQVNRDLVITGTDANPTTVLRSDNTVTKKKDDAFYVITDIAGNSLRIDVRDGDRDKLDRFGIFALTYNDGQAIIEPENRYNVSYQANKDAFTVKEQNFEIDNEVKIRIQYNRETDTSTVIIRESGSEKVKETKRGLVLLKLLTNGGNLDVVY